MSSHRNRREKVRSLCQSCRSLSRQKRCPGCTTRRWINFAPTELLVELKSIIRWLLSVVFGAVVFLLLVWCVLCVRFAGCCCILQTGHITLSFTPNQQLEIHSMEYHRQQPLYNTLELLMMGIVVPETC